MDSLRQLRLIKVQKEVILKPKEDIDRYPVQLKGFRSSLNEGEYLKFRIRVDGYGKDPKDKTGKTNTGLRFYTNLSM